MTNKKQTPFQTCTHWACLINWFQRIPEWFVMVHTKNIKIRNLPAGYLATASSVQEMELNTQTKHISAKCEKQVKVSNGQWQWADCITLDVHMDFH